MKPLPLYERRGSAVLWWLNKAQDLHGAAAVIYHAMCNEGIEIKKEYGLEEGYSFRIALPGVFVMNAGLSLELLLKAIILIKKDGEHSKIPKIHNLSKLAEKSEIYSLFDTSQKHLLENFSTYIVWAGKYPIPTKSKEYDDALKISEKSKTTHKEGGLTLEKTYPEMVLNWENYDNLWEVIMSEFWIKYGEKYNA